MGKEGVRDKLEAICWMKLCFVRQGNEWRGSWGANELAVSVGHPRRGSASSWRWGSGTQKRGSGWRYESEYRQHLKVWNKSLLGDLE